MHHTTRLLSAALALTLMTTTAFAVPISTPLGCQDGTREEPVPPTIIPGYTEVVPDILHPEWIEDVPDIQHDGYVEVTPDIVHPAYVEVVEDIVHPATTQFTPGADKTRWEVFGDKFCYRAETLLGGPGYDRAFKPDCLTMWDTKSMASNTSKPGKKIVIPGYTEVVPDIEHPERVEDVPDIQHDGYVEVTPDIIHPAYTEVVEDIVHPEQVVENPPIEIATKTIKYKDVTFSTRPPFVIIDFHYETTDGTCSN